MITVKYEDSKTGQTATFSISPTGDGAAAVNIKFDPPASDDMENPFGILGKLAEFFTGEEA
jgi:hypothetical protein